MTRAARAIMAARMDGRRRPRVWAWLGRRLTPLAASVALLGLAAPGVAQNLRKLVNETELTGDWGGARTDLGNHGIHVAFQYWTNLAGNPVGGQRQGFTYTDSLNLAIDFDFHKLFAWKGGALHFTFTNRDGTSLSQSYIGNIFTVQQIYGPLRRTGSRSSRSSSRSPAASSMPSRDATRRAISRRRRSIASS